MLKDHFLGIFNVIAIVAILFVIAFMWIYMSQQFMWAPILVILILLLVLYVNTRKLLVRYIEERKKSLNKPVDAKAEQRLNLVNGLAIIAIILVAVLGWVYMSQQFMWAVTLIIIILLLLGVINAGKLISDIK
jgi:hypothetical protein